MNRNESKELDHRLGNPGGRQLSKNPALTNNPALMVFVIGLLLGLLYWHLIPHTHNYPHAGKEFYVGAKLLAAGKNPYSSHQLQAASREYAPEGMVAGFERQPQIHLPATLAVLTTVSWLPWPLFCFLQVLVSAFCIPAIVYLCLRYLTPLPSLPSLGVLSLGLAFLPPVWQNIVIGQVTLPLVLIFLLLARSFAQHRVRSLGLLAFLALLKFTFALPLLVFVFWKGSRAQRLAMVTAAAGFVLLNSVAVLRIGPNGFRAGYHAQVNNSFGPGGLNDVHTSEGQTARIDLDSLLALSHVLPAEGFLKAAAWAFLLGLFLYQVGRWDKSGRRSHGGGQEGLGLWHVSALSLLTLLLFYHRTYDAVLLVPCLFFGFKLWEEGRRQEQVKGLEQAERREHTGLVMSGRRRSRSIPLTLVALILVCFGSIGNGDHNVLDFVLHRLHASSPPYVHSLLALTVYLVLVLSSVREESQDRGDNQEPEHPSHADKPDAPLFARKRTRGQNAA